MTAVNADKDRVRFLAGTCNLRAENEICLIEYQEDDNQVICQNTFSHPHEIWHLAASPLDPSLFLSVYDTSETGYRTTLWKLHESGKGKLESVCDLQGHVDVIKGVWWHTEGKRIVSVDESTLRHWSLADGGAREISALTPQGHRFDHGCWDPHETSLFATISEAAVSAWDLRSNKEAFRIEHTHRLFANDVDWNPCNPYHLVTGGDDRKLNFWDCRKPDAPLLSQLGHAHWVCQVKFNPVHDQYLISSGTYGFVNLWSASSVARKTAYLDDASEDTKDKKPVDGLVKKYSEHEESVYSLCWSSASTFIFASMSNDGRVVINHMPQEEIYKVLL
eukprot:TRINITY_DN6637_c0_g1_i1.p1 TRINITY_DN6637_c0_g1~~TRINITY_DN6637_c0_g1_i1.p1  ORF type:complete len:360 (-),score=58.85 TRINITY_DN6637_c0_g1_i1:12-1013(-)